MGGADDLPVLRGPGRRCAGDLSTHASLFAHKLGLEPSPQLAALQSAILNYRLPSIQPQDPTSWDSPVLVRFERLAAAAHARTIPEEVIAAAEQALDLAGEPAFQWAYATAAEADRAHLQEMISAVEELQVDRWAAAGRLDEAVHRLATLVEAQPLRERARPTADDHALPVREQSGGSRRLPGLPHPVARGRSDPN